MKCKPGDIVEHCGKLVRVMRLGAESLIGDCKLSHGGWIEATVANNLKVVQSAPKPAIHDGDSVLINGIPTDEKDSYGPFWSSEMDAFVISGKPYTVTGVRYSNSLGWIGCVNGYTFQLYHIEPFHHFDIL